MHTHMGKLARRRMPMHFCTLTHMHTRTFVRNVTCMSVRTYTYPRTSTRTVTQLGKLVHTYAHA